MTKGTIVLTPFPFTDLSAIKRRPAVIVSSSEKTEINFWAVIFEIQNVYKITISMTGNTLKGRR
ncbi:MAG: hypothetical protein DCC43_05905 [Candidatus Brocadia sp.]|jgi:hypothetical protein|uniref:Type II toxin-antitoxin system PemK/MazF family toxin n=1 Tax=Candidatus Brocadia fulgida TaxID=380242 RepID=A0A0M2UXC6_9BACT|nr:MAG: hypothetical protein BROFUL_01070 [Candidatus Brocadia fulgida]MBV6518127.1 hypothetical protein [Candidatus Brocadia fulgida]MCE7910579.1 hypothetical protein [Candidatus Brocadia sp. AMX3]RIK01441.1 MAG: hypothetical protein DCC43_05905 [Candidatus Brocadia sp.]